MRSVTDLQQLEKEIKKVEPQKQKLINPLLKNAIFMAQELEKLKADIKSFGWVDAGKQSPEGRAFNQLMGNFNTTIKNIYLILEDKPDGKQKPQTQNAAFKKINRGDK